MKKTTKVLLSVGLLLFATVASAAGAGTGDVSFAKSYARLKKWEGGFQDDPDDEGNYNSLGQNVGTNFGVSAKMYEDYVGHPPTKAEMKSMTEATAMAIFKERYWDKRMWGDKQVNQPLADIVLDGVVNHGQGVRLLQQVLGNVATDNAYGPETHAAVMFSDPADLYVAYRERRRQYYNELVEAKPSRKKFLKGWMNRINSFDDY